MVNKSNNFNYHIALIVEFYFRLLVGRNRWIFLQQSLKDLDSNLRKINSRLFVVRGDPKTSFPKLFKSWNISTITFEHDIEPYAVERDTLIEKMAKESDIKIIKEYSHTIFNPEVVVKKNGGKPPMTYQKFLSIASTLSVPKPLDPPGNIPKSCYPDDDEKANYDVPSLKELEIEDNAKIHFPGGETEGLRRMEENIRQKKFILDFEKPKTSPNSLTLSTTGLSAYLKFGCLSSRLFYAKIKDVYKGNKHSQPPVSLEGQVIWREFYYTVAAVTPNFDKMVGNPICAQIPWQSNDKFLKAWKSGQTGYPFIDAIMRQLEQEGWIHHLARHAVACFLTRGDLWCHWEDGMKVFEEYLLDADWALNAGNWMWLSASAFFHQYFRVYSPVAFGKKTDPNGDFIRKYVPELKNYPSGIIYEPWKANIKSQEAYKCVLGKDYPHRIVDHDVIMKTNLEKMKKAYANKNSDSASTSSVGDKRKAEKSPVKSTKSPKIEKKAKPQSNNLKKYFK